MSTWDRDCGGRAPCSLVGCGTQRLDLQCSQSMLMLGPAAQPCSSEVSHTGKLGGQGTQEVVSGQDFSPAWAGLSVMPRIPFSLHISTSQQNSLGLASWERIHCKILGGSFIYPKRHRGGFGGHTPNSPALPMGMDPAAYICSLESHGPQLSCFHNDYL